MEVSATGVVSGRWTSPSVGDCTLTGTAVQATPASAKNLFAMSLTAAAGPSAACTLSSTAYAGFAAITFTNIGSVTAPTYVRSVTFLVRNNASWFSGELPKS